MCAGWGAPRISTVANICKHSQSFGRDIVFFDHDFYSSSAPKNSNNNQYGPWPPHCFLHHWVDPHLPLGSTWILAGVSHHAEALRIMARTLLTPCMPIPFSKVQKGTRFTVR